MLRELAIYNLALIESLNLVFGADRSSVPGSGALAVLTGETGAGKSIILQALNLLAGCKASNTWIRTGADSGSVEAFFDIDPNREDLLKTLHDKGFAVEDSIILKRIISRQGRSRYFINSSLANADILAFVCENLFSVASQHEHQILLNPRHHLDFIDSVGNLREERTRFGELFSQWNDLKGQYEKLRRQEQDREQRRDLLAFQIKEIRDSALQDRQDEELAAERQVLRSSDTLMESAQACYEILSEAVSSNLHQGRKNLEQMELHDASVKELVERTANSCYEIDDLTRQLYKYLHAIPSDPGRLEQIEERIDLLQKLKRKYGGQEKLLAAVITYGEKAAAELADLDTMDQRLAGMERDLAAVEKELTAKAAKLSEARSKSAAHLETVICSELNSLSFADPAFHVQFEALEKTPATLSPTGWDQVEFMFSANPGEPAKPLAKIASGGELSRLLLGLKCILARRDQVGTVVFDEVDAGIGGQAAEDIAQKIKQLARYHQVLCITHLPQIAARADEHFRVEKLLKEKRTITAMTLLDPEKRINELARMLAGTSVTDETIAFARKLLEKGRMAATHENS